MKICRETLWNSLGPEMVHMLPWPLRVVVAGNDCFSLANYNDWPRWWELNSLSLCIVHLFRFICRLPCDSVIWLTRLNFTLWVSGIPLSGQDGFFADLSATSSIVMLRWTMKVDLVFYGPFTRSVWHIGEVHFSKVVNFPFPWNLTTGVFGVWMWNMKQLLLVGHAQNC
jgi:hypothetical protein